MEKKSKPIEIKSTSKLNERGDKIADQFGNYSFIIKFDNNDSGFFITKDDQASQFKVGEEITYIFEEKPKKDGSGTYTKISLPKPAFTPGAKSGGYQQMTLEEYIARQKVDSIGYMLSYASKQSEAGIIAPEKVTELAKTWLDWTYMHMDKLILKNK